MESNELYSQNGDGLNAELSFHQLRAGVEVHLAEPEDPSSNPAIRNFDK